MAVDDTAVTPVDTAVVVNVASNDNDPDGNLDPNTAAPNSQPLNGSASSNNDGTITYTPDANFNGADQFTYEICDDLGLCDSAVVDVTVNPVNDPPVANDDSSLGNTPNTAVTLSATANDTDANGDPLMTKVWGYGKTRETATYPGRSFVVYQGRSRSPSAPLASRFRSTRSRRESRRPPSTGCSRLASNQRHALPYQSHWVLR